MGKAAAYPRMELRSGRHQAYLKTSGLGCKVLPGTNALPNYENSQITEGESFIRLGPNVNSIEHFYSSQVASCLSLVSIFSLV